MSKNEELARFLEEGQKLFDQRLFVEAERVLDKALAIDPRSVEALFWRGVSRLGADKYDGAIADFNAVLRLDENHNNARCFRGEAYLEKFELDAARKDFLEVVKRNPVHGRAYEGLANVCTVRGDSQGTAHYLTLAIVKGGPTCERFRDRGLCFAALGKKKKAMKDYDEAVRLDPNDIETRRLRADLALYWDDNEGSGEALAKKASDDLTQILRLEPDDWEALWKRATLLTESNQFQEALADCKRLHDLDPAKFSGDTLLLHTRAMARLGLGDGSGAIEDLSSALKIDKDCDLALAGRAEAYFRCGKWRQCIADLDREIAIEPRSVDAFVRRGRAKQELREYEAALRDFSHVIEKFPESKHTAVALYWRARLYDVLREPKKAEADRDRAFSIDPALRENRPK